MTAANISRTNDRLCVDSRTDAYRQALIARALPPAANAAASTSTDAASANEPLAMPRVDFVVRTDALQNPALLELINAERLSASSLPLADDKSRLAAQTRRIELSAACGRALRLGGEEIKSGRMSRCSRLNMKVRRPFEALLRGFLKPVGTNRTLSCKTPRILAMPSAPLATFSSAGMLSSGDAASEALLFNFSLFSLERIAQLRREGVANPIAVRGIIFDDRQLAGIAASGADAVLLSMSLLSAAGFESLSKSAALLGLEAGAEADSVDGILNAVRLNAPVISIRSIDDEDQKENLARIAAIGDFVPPHAVLVAGAGIDSEKSLKRVERMAGRACIAVEDVKSAQEEEAFRLAAS